MLDLSRVFKVYNGKANRCCCGCSGKYHVASALREVADQDRGYPYDDKDVNDETVRKIVGKILSASKPKDEGDHVHATVGGRLYVAFYK
jgi:hypothetical protein